ncbi:sigma-70 family RNA polymerase sigma factor [uncultured Clostridium sp.]|uniref:sigma-70 family RNA polymerase sigma factor n=1 Tax=uncultured Clostridium sp. TaxID=59620 RepID=UPI0025F729E4|nr:sigma-70 family RNA polymerase sigma factor [uncultured Clostridium sp.]MDU4883579.1 sigma-70 family RNA polymerase sigma factor [Clostridium celatum]MDU7076897.1 sigma-70 family RNA polymerase sigma factor [Clostridium celatum]
MENILIFKRKTLKSRLKSLSEEELIKSAIHGNCEAYAQVIKNNKEYLYKMAYVYVNDSNKALDVLQECTYKGFKSIKTLRNPKYFKTWITRILINIAISMLKQDSKIVYLDDNNPLEEGKSFINIEEKIDLYNAIEMLKNDYKIIVIMKYFNDMTIDEISNILNIPVNTVKTRLSRARSALKNILKEEYLND